jgi:hypothetical protein
VFHGGHYLDLQRMAILRSEWAEGQAATPGGSAGSSATT